MFYRLPFLFSASCYILLSLAQLLIISNLVQNLSPDYIFSFYHVSKMLVENLTIFFFLLILSCIFFYQKKIYFYTLQNKKRVLFFSIIFTIFYIVFKIFSNKFAVLLLLANFIGDDRNYNYQYENFYTLIHQFGILIVDVWFYILSAVVLFFMTKMSTKYFQRPLIDNAIKATKHMLSHETLPLNSDLNVSEYKKLYAVIFSAFFCCIANGILWNINLNLFASLSDLKMFVDEYYSDIFQTAVFSVIVNYCFFYFSSQKFINKTYTWIPITSLLMSSVLTFVLYCFIIFIMSCLTLPFVISFKSVFLFIIWILINYVLLYFFSGLILKRYFS